MEILVIGLGSMGKRRIRLLKEAFHIETIYGVDSREDRREFVEKTFCAKTYSSIKSAMQNSSPKVVFICTAPLSHSKIILECLDYDLDIFTEINLVSDDYDEIIKKSKARNCKLFLSSTPLYRKEMEYIISKVQSCDENLNYIYHCGQYLPDWHPWEQFNDFFVNDKRTNGCREIFAIELPWLISAFGKVESVFSQKSKNSKLNINYNDNYIVTLQHSSGHKGVICFDVISRMAIRKFEVYGENIHIFWDGAPTSLYSYDFNSRENNKIDTYKDVLKDKKYSDSIIENMYIDEITHFFEYVNNGVEPKHTFEKDFEVLGLIDEIEEG